MIKVQITDNKGEVSEIRCNRLELRHNIMICGESICALVNLAHVKQVEVMEDK